MLPYQIASHETNARTVPAMPKSGSGVNLRATFSCANDIGSEDRDKHQPDSPDDEHGQNKGQLGFYRVDGGRLALTAGRWSLLSRRAIT